MIVTAAGEVNANVPGAYTITYRATDASANTAMTTRTVNVVDTTKPVITLTGPNPLTVGRHSSLADPGATATDACTGNIAVISRASRMQLVSRAPGERHAIQSGHSRSGSEEMIAKGTQFSLRQSHSFLVSSA